MDIEIPSIGDFDLYAHPDNGMHAELIIYPETRVLDIVWHHGIDTQTRMCWEGRATSIGVTGHHGPTVEDVLTANVATIISIMNAYEGDGRWSDESDGLVEDLASKIWECPRVFRVVDIDNLILEHRNVADLVDDLILGREADFFPIYDAAHQEPYRNVEEIVTDLVSFASYFEEYTLEYWNEEIVVDRDDLAKRARRYARERLEETAAA